MAGYQKHQQHCTALHHSDSLCHCTGPAQHNLAIRSPLLHALPAGRGALDVKIGVVGLLEAALALLNEGYQPKRTLMLAFGQDEESSGFAGAAQIAGGCRQPGANEVCMVGSAHC